MPDVTQHLLKPGSHIPNNQKLPVLYYQQVYTKSDNLTAQYKNAFENNNWKGIWVDGVFDYHHYHSKSHEVLGVAGGTAKLILGGPDGDVFSVKAGDMVVLPAGTGHCLLSASSDFTVVGAYPSGQENYDICTEDDDMQVKQKNIQQVPLPTTDPITGEQGPLTEHWKPL